MTSSTSSSSRVARAGPAWLAAILLGACAGPRVAPPPPRGRVAVLPPANLSGAAAPAQELRIVLEAALRERGVDLVEPAVLEEFLARHRLRYTGGLDRAAALAAEAELGVVGVLVTTIELFRPSDPPKLGVVQRLVSVGSEPAILWIDGSGHTGDESPGAFDLGLIADLPTLRAKVFRELAASLASFLAGTGPRASACAGARRYEPKSRFRSHLMEPGAPRTVAVLPFLNETPRRNAGELLALEFARQLEAAGNFRVVEPGLVRDELLRYRIVMEKGVSLDTARITSELLHADLVVAGAVRDYQDAAVPKVDFTALVLDRQNSEILWQSSSNNLGDDGVFFFDLGMESTAAGLACRMVRRVVEGLNQQPATPAPAPRAPPVKAPTPARPAGRAR